MSIKTWIQCYKRTLQKTITEKSYQRDIFRNNTSPSRLKQKLIASTLCNNYIKVHRPKTLLEAKYLQLWGGLEIHRQRLTGDATKCILRIIKKIQNVLFLVYRILNLILKTFFIISEILKLPEQQRINV